MQQILEEPCRWQVIRCFAIRWEGERRLRLPEGSLLVAVPDEERFRIDPYQS